MNMEISISTVANKIINNYIAVNGIVDRCILYDVCDTNIIACVECIYGADVVKAFIDSIINGKFDLNTLTKAVFDYINEYTEQLPAADEPDEPDDEQITIMIIM